MHEQAETILPDFARWCLYFTSSLFSYPVLLLSVPLGVIVIMNLKVLDGKVLRLLVQKENKWIIDRYRQTDRQAG